MSLKITNITLKDVRGYKNLQIDDISDLTIIVGPNAVGKTNIIEAIQLLTTGTSFRKPSPPEVVSWGKEHGYASIELEGDKRHIEHKAVIDQEKRLFEINGKKKTPSSIRSSLPCVLFTPDDLQLIKASSVKRRDAIDTLAIQLSKNYSSLKKNYQQALQQRNLLIKEGIHSGDLFNSWDESLALHGARLGLTRWRLFNRISKRIDEIYPEIAGEESINSLYIPSWDRLDSKRSQINDIASYEESIDSNTITIDGLKDILLQRSQENANQELHRGISLIGPHKDEIAFFINGKNARLFASQGQQRTIVLALKIASVMLINEILGVEPVLLLDDVMSELDEKHRSALMGFIQKNTQTFITTTNIDYFDSKILENATIIEVPIKGTRYEYE